VQSNSSYSHGLAASNISHITSVSLLFNVQHNGHVLSKHILSEKKHKRKVLWNFMADVDITVVFYVKCK